NFLLQIGKVRKLRIRDDHQRLPKTLSLHHGAWCAANLAGNHGMRDFAQLKYGMFLRTGFLRRWLPAVLTLLNKTASTFLLRPVLLPDAQGPAAAFLGGEVVRAIFAGGSEAEFHRVGVELVNAELFLPLTESFEHQVVDGLRLFGWVDGEFGFHE